MHAPVLGLTHADRLRGLKVKIDLTAAFQQLLFANSPETHHRFFKMTAFYVGTRSRAHRVQPGYGGIL
jgi:hypothetical protein